MFKKIKGMPLAITSFALMFLANIAVSTNTTLMWHEIECPKELLDK